MATAKELQQELVANMRKWQKIENTSVSSTGQIIEKTDHLIIRLATEIIQRDSLMHYRAQEAIADSIELKEVSLTVDEPTLVWDMIVSQMMTGSGRWPFTIFMPPDKKPFFTATYIPRGTRWQC